MAGCGGAGTGNCLPRRGVQKVATVLVLVPSLLVIVVAAPWSTDDAVARLGWLERPRIFPSQRDCLLPGAGCVRGLRLSGGSGFAWFRECLPVSCLGLRDRVAAHSRVDPASQVSWRGSARSRQRGSDGSGDPRWGGAEDRVPFAPKLPRSNLLPEDAGSGGDVLQGWLRVKNSGLLGAWGQRWVTARRGVLSIHEAGPMSQVMSNVVLLGARVERANFASVWSSAGNAFGLSVHVDVDARAAAAPGLPDHILLPHVALVCGDELMRERWITGLRACTMEGGVEWTGIAGGRGLSGDRGARERELESAELGSDLVAFDCEEVDAWLQVVLKDIRATLGSAAWDAAEVRRAFRDNLVNGHGLLRLTHSHLKDMGIQQFGIRQQLLHAIAHAAGVVEEPDEGSIARRIYSGFTEGGGDFGRSLPRRPGVQVGFQARGHMASVPASPPARSSLPPPVSSPHSQQPWGGEAGRQVQWHGPAVASASSSPWARTWHGPPRHLSSPRIPKSVSGPDQGSEQGGREGAGGGGMLDQVLSGFCSLSSALFVSPSKSAVAGERWDGVDRTALATEDGRDRGHERHGGAIDVNEQALNAMVSAAKQTYGAGRVGRQEGEGKVRERWERVRVTTARSPSPPRYQGALERTHRHKETHHRTPCGCICMLACMLNRARRHTQARIRARAHTHTHSIIATQVSGKCRGCAAGGGQCG